MSAGPGLNSAKMVSKKNVKKQSKNGLEDLLKDRGSKIKTNNRDNLIRIINKIINLVRGEGDNKAVVDLYEGNAMDEDIVFADIMKDMGEFCFICFTKAFLGPRSILCQFQSSGNSLRMGFKARVDSAVDCALLSLAHNNPLSWLLGLCINPSSLTCEANLIQLCQSVLLF